MQNFHLDCFMLPKLCKPNDANLLICVIMSPIIILIPKNWNDCHPRNFCVDFIDYDLSISPFLGKTEKERLWNELIQTGGLCQNGPTFSQGFCRG